MKITFKRVYVRNDADWFGSGEFYFIAKVGETEIGDRRKRFNAVEGTWIDLPAAQWSTIVDLAGKPKLVVTFQGKDEDLLFDDDLGDVGHTFRRPWTQNDFHQQTKYYILEWTAEIVVDGAFGLHPPNTVYACRENNGSVKCTTVSGDRITARLEFHPVRPVPPNGLPPRAPFPAGSGPSVKNAGGTSPTPADPLNVIPNPAVIPILSPPAPPAPAVAPALAAGAPPRATDQNAARIEFTYYRPNSLAFTDNDARLEWTARTAPGAAAGAVSFLGPPKGLKVMVYGTTAGEVLLEVRMLGALMATYRALVLKVKAITCRCNILNGPTADSRPRATPANVQDHLAIANRYLYQAGLQLVLDTNRAVSHGAVHTATPGIFRISVSRGTTRRIDSDVVSVRATQLNYRPNVMNFAYIFSERRANIAGAATDFPASNVPAAAGARPSITDSGTPSDSWASPTGILPDAAAGVTTMNLLRAIQRPGHPHLFAMILCDNAGDPAVLAGQQVYANNMCHELGHILNLGHRVEGADPAGVTAANPSGKLHNGIFWDGLSYPPHENVMYFDTSPLTQDFDIIQARAMHRSPLVPP